MVTPPNFLESLVRRLLPPAVREQVLGDLHERYESPLGYIADAASVVPAAIFSQLRRATPVPFRLLEALIIYSSFFVAARLLDGLYGPPDPSQVARLAMIAMAGLLWHDIYYVRPPESELITELKRDFSWFKWIQQKPFGDVYLAMLYPYGMFDCVWSVWQGVRPHPLSVLGLFNASLLISWLRRRIGKRRPSVGA